MSRDAMLGILLPVAFLVVFPLFWCAVTWIIGATGWRSLARLYPDSNPPTEYALDGVFGRTGAGQYRGVLQLTVTDAGIHVAVFPIFRVGHPPICIPFSAIESVGRGGRVKWLSTRAINVRGTRVSLALRDSTFDEIKHMAGARWPVF